jgi:subtilase family serine protease
MRRYPHFSRFLVPILGAAALLLPATPGQSQRQTLQTRASAPAEAQWLGRLPSSQNLRLSLSLPLRNESQLKVLLKQLNDPTSANYRKFLTVQQFTEQFGPTADDYAKVVSFAKAHGLTVTRTFSNRLVVNVSGSAANVGQDVLCARRRAYDRSRTSPTNC